MLTCCIICKKEYSHKGIYTHYDRAHGTKEVKSKYSNGNNGKYDSICLKRKQHTEQLILNYNQNPAMCKNCNSILPYKQRDYQFCSSSCSVIYFSHKRTQAGYKQSKESKDKIRNAIIHYREENKLNLTPLLIKKCNYCITEFETKNNTKQYCCRKCAFTGRKQNTIAKRTNWENYKAQCKFTFSLNEFPDKFDLKLIEQFGWYKAKNRGNNLNGISRDHMISINYGFSNNISPKIISHPANCNLLTQPANSAKHTSNSITIEELIERINTW